LRTVKGVGWSATSEAIIKTDEAGEQFIAGDSLGDLPITHVWQLHREAMHC
jgi:hypothetical protein